MIKDSVPLLAGRIEIPTGKPSHPGTEDKYIVYENGIKEPESVTPLAGI
jgi:hypothetical protein